MAGDNQIQAAKHYEALLDALLVNTHRAASRVVANRLPNVIQTCSVQTPITEAVNRLCRRDPVERLMERRVMLNLERLLDRAVTCVWGLDSDLDRALSVTRNRDRCKDLADAIVNARTLSNALDLHGIDDYASVIDGDLALLRHVLSHTSARVQTLANNLEHVYYRGVHNGLGGALWFVLCMAVDLGNAAAALGGAANDFRAADLRSAQLEKAELVGVCWNQQTQWPGRWEDYVHRASYRATDGTFIIRAKPHNSFEPVIAP